MLKAGDIAPDFTQNDENGDSFTLSSLRGSKVVLFFYPHDNTPTCTEEACNLRDNYEDLKKAGYEVIGISDDSEKKHQNFINKYDLPYKLIADTDQTVLKLYDRWQQKETFGKKYMGTVRTTYLIDESGVIERVIDQVKAKQHTEQILIDN